MVVFHIGYNGQDNEKSHIGSAFVLIDRLIFNKIENNYFANLKTHIKWLN